MKSVPFVRKNWDRRKSSATLAIGLYAKHMSARFAEDVVNAVACAAVQITYHEIRVSVTATSDSNYI